MKDILKKCNKEDFEYLDAVLDSYVAFTNDSKRKQIIKESFLNPNKKRELISLVDKQIRYYGSSDLAYVFRSIFNNDGGVSGLELVGDVADKLKHKLKHSNSVESNLESLAVAIVNKELISKKPEELIEAVRKMDIMSDQDLNQFKEHIKKSGSAIALPVFLKMLGPKVTLKLIENILIGVISYFIGATAARQIVTEILKRNPLLNALGPVVWVVSGTWLAFDMQGPAYRKTIPICLYLGIVSLRDGLEER